MSSGLSLKIVHWIPVAIKYNDSIGCGQVYSQPTGSRGKQETKILRTICVEMIQGSAAFVTAYRSIQSLKRNKKGLFVRITTLHLSKSLKPFSLKTSKRRRQIK